MKFQFTSILLLFVFLLGILQIPSSHAAPIKKLKEKPTQVPLYVLQKAIQYVQDSKDANSAQVLEKLEARDVQTLYEVAKAMNSSTNKEEMLTSIEIWDALAEGGHTLSQVALGFAYAENDKRRAIMYFVTAGENGPHQAALFNAGRLLADPEIADYVKSLAYVRAAYRMKVTRPEYSTDKMVETSKETYEKLSEHFAEVILENVNAEGSMFDINHVSNMFEYAHIDLFPPGKSLALRDWTSAMRALQFREFEMAFVEYGMYEKNYGAEMSDLQKAIVKVLKTYCEAASLNYEL